MGTFIDKSKLKIKVFTEKKKDFIDCRHFLNQNFEIFDEVLNNFGRFDDDMIKWKNNDFHSMHMWSHAQLAQKKS